MYMPSIPTPYYHRGGRHTTQAKTDASEWQQKCIATEARLAESETWLDKAAEERRRLLLELNRLRGLPGDTAPDSRKVFVVEWFPAVAGLTLDCKTLVCRCCHRGRITRILALVCIANTEWVHLPKILRAEHSWGLFG